MVWNKPDDHFDNQRARSVQTSFAGWKRPWKYDTGALFSSRICVWRIVGNRIDLLRHRPADLRRVELGCVYDDPNGALECPGMASASRDLAVGAPGLV
jgi:hypothetical protein